jgi:hypothetical protein
MASIIANVDPVLVDRKRFPIGEASKLTGPGFLFSRSSSISERDVKSALNPVGRNKIHNINYSR